MKRLVYVCAAASVLAACAATPESIAPAYVSEVQYQSWSCEQLGQEIARVNAAYGTAADQQHKARGNDTVGVLLLGLPVSSLSGQNVAGQIANLKGHQEAIQRTAIQKNCSGITADQSRARAK